MQAIFKNLVCLEKKQKDQDMEDDHKNWLRNLSNQVVERLSKSKDGIQCRKTASQMTYLNMSKVTSTGAKPHECSTYGKVFMQHISPNRHRRCHGGQKQSKYQEYDDKSYKCKECGKTFSYHHCFFKHEKTHTREKPYVNVRNVGKPSFITQHVQDT
nr:unnamed protein product [Pongo abelii]